MLFFLIFALFSTWALARKAEAREWNEGVCKRSGLPWKSFCTDSSGATGYEDGAGNTMWRSYKQ